MTNDTNKPIAGHSYDGIEELDNPLPMWWLATFFGTIIFGFVYYLHYEISGVTSLKTELAASMAEINALKKTGPSFTEEKLAAAFTEAGAKKGQEVYTGKCLACHGPELGGLIGPNLTDKAWIHGKGTRLDIMNTVAQGVLDKGMPAWAEMISQEELVNVVAFVYSKKNTNVAGGKPPQGTEYP